jgi:fatty acid desaturase
VTELLTPPTTGHRPTDHDLREQALRRLAKKREFRVHLLAYVLVNAFLWLIWGVIYFSAGFWFPWPLFPLGGWGIGLVFHAWDTYGRRPFSEDAVAREIQRIGRWGRT